uniref:Uncharacterized protein n=1 Tax=candidate division WOR-3 bacterium TaxID=2052148 RepID=A0A7C4UBP3_UNCW3
MENSNLDEKLPKRLKLKGKKEFEEVFKKGKVFKGFFLIASSLNVMKESLEYLLIKRLEVELKGIR